MEFLALPVERCINLPLRNSREVIEKILPRLSRQNIVEQLRDEHPGANKANGTVKGVELVVDNEAGEGQRLDWFPFR